MLNAPSKSLHPRWGRDIRSYPAIYTNKALAGRLKVPVKARDRAALRTIGLRAIEEICMLGESKIESSEYNEIFESIKLQKLESVLEFTRFPNEYENFAIPKLVAGCIELLSYTTPSPFAYEYGYLCFRILVFALNTCFLKYAGAWKETVDEMQSKSSGLHISCFWDRSADVALQEIVYFECREAISYTSFDSIRSRRWSVPYFDQQKLDDLISTLHSDRKNFLIALRDTGSLGLSSLFFILQRHVKSKQPKMEPTEFVEKVAVPFSRVFYRYQIVLPNLGIERFVSRHLFLGSLGDFTDTLLIDMDDSRNVLRAYINSVKPPYYPNEVFFGDGIPFNFFLPHVVPGCEDLIPGLFEATMKVLWNALLGESEQLHRLNDYVRLVMYHFNRLLNRLQEQVIISRAIENSWIYKLADKVVENDVVGLLLRSILLKSTPEPENIYYGPKAQYRWTSSQQFTNLVTFLPGEYLSLRLNQTGAIWDWFKYHMHLDPLALDCSQVESTKSGLTIQGIVARLIPNLFFVLVGERLENDLLLTEMGKVCSNPRCPAPFKAGVTRGRIEPDGPYCSSRCMDM